SCARHLAALHERAPLGHTTIGKDRADAVTQLPGDKRKLQFSLDQAVHRLVLVGGCLDAESAVGLAPKPGRSSFAGDDLKLVGCRPRDRVPSKIPVCRPPYPT